MTEFVTVTERGMATIPAKIRRKYKIRPGAKLRVEEATEGVLLVPVPRFEDLYAADGKLALQMRRELQEERTREAEHDSGEL